MTGDETGSGLRFEPGREPSPGPASVPGATLDPRAAPSEADLVALQLGRAPRDAWRVAARCVYGLPTAIVSPSLLSDGTPFPTYAWLTCPWLAEQIGGLESAGAAAAWTARAQTDSALAAELRATDARLREARRSESGGTDACESVGLAGQRDPLKVKCLHAHAALELVGIHDPIGRAVLCEIESVCPDRRCGTLAPPGHRDRA